MANADFWADVMEWEHIVEGAQEGLSDLEAQYQAEVAMFGDAWPGAVQDLEQARVVAAMAVANLAALLAIA